MSDCIFCKIGAKQIPAELVYEDKYSFALLDVHPHAPGHLLVIPREHAPTLVELARERVGPLFEAVRRLDAAVLKALHADGMTIGINQGKVSGQAVEHLHVHLLPRFFGDGGSSVHGVVRNLPEEPLAEIAKKIRSCLA